VFDQTTEQDDVYKGADVDTMVKNCIDGFHSTIFCYGQTGSGKTYTMDGYKYKKSERGLFLPIINEQKVEDSTHGLVQRSVR